MGPLVGPAEAGPARHSPFTERSSLGAPLALAKAEARQSDAANLHTAVRIPMLPISLSFFAMCCRAASCRQSGCRAPLDPPPHTPVVVRPISASLKQDD